MGFVCGVFILLTLTALAQTKVVNDFKECNEFFLDETAPTVLPDQNRYKWICQNHGENADINKYATLYDTKNRIPVYSVYTYGGCKAGKRNKNWATEPQLDLGQQAGDKQALDIDYKKIKDFNKPHGYNRGHLFPVCHTESQSAADATFTLTNIVPQNVEFNNGAWNVMENNVLENIKSNLPLNNKAYIVTGAVPSKNNLVNNRVNIPDYMWTAFCYKKDNRWVSKAHYGRNAQGEVLFPVSLEKLEEQLKIDYGPRQRDVSASQGFYERPLQKPQMLLFFLLVFCLCYALACAVFCLSHGVGVFERCRGSILWGASESHFPDLRARHPPPLPSGGFSPRESERTPGQTLSCRSSCAHLISLEALYYTASLQDVVTRAESYTNLNALSLFSGARQRDVSANQGFYERPLQKPQMLGTSLISSRGVAFRVITLICVFGCWVLCPWDVRHHRPQSATTFLSCLRSLGPSPLRCVGIVALKAVYGTDRRVKASDVEDLITETLRFTPHTGGKERQISFMIGLTPGQCSGTSPVQYLEKGKPLQQPTIRKLAKDFSTTQAANYIAVSPEQNPDVPEEKKCSEFRILREPTEGWDLNPGQQQRAMTGAEWLGGKLEQTLQGGGCVVFYTTNSPCLKKCFSDTCERKIDTPLSQEPFSQWNIENKVHKYFTYTQLYLNDDSAQVQALT
ncbi:UNVERIFIED_CONTAM: hypothetical protein FKN15_075654 [Acipenser sinensis]